MRKETITYVDFNGEERSEDFYFNMTAADIAMLEFRLEGGMDAYITKIINERDQEKIIDTFCKIIDLSYGVKGLDGGFYKDADNLRKFKASQAYSDLFMKLMDAEYAAQFVNDIMPKEQSKNTGDRNVSAVDKAKAEAMARLQVINGSEGGSSTES